MKSKNLSIVFALFWGAITFAQVGINTENPHPSSDLELGSVDKALLLNRVADTDAVSNPVNGMVIYDISQKCVRAYQGDPAEWSGCLGNGNGGGTNPSVSGLTCGSSTQNGNVVAGQLVSGATVSIPYTGGNGASYPQGTSITASGGTVTGISVQLQAGNLANGSGTLLYDIIGTPDSAGTATFTLSFGGQTCTLTVTVTASPHVDSINCAGAVQNGTIYSGTTASGVTLSVPYTGGNGPLPYNAGTGISSTGVTGLTATLVAGTLANGSGTFTYNITGTPSGPGAALFNLSFNGVSCTNAAVTVILSGGGSIAGSVKTFDVQGHETDATSSFTASVCSNPANSGKVRLIGSNNFYGQFGNGTSTVGSHPYTTGAVATANLFDSANPAIGVEVSNAVSYILKNDGTVWASGGVTPYEAILGQGPSVTTPQTTPIQVKGQGGSGFLTNVRTLTAGSHCAFAIKDDGSVWSWGSASNYYILGTGTNTAQYYPVPVHDEAGGYLTNVVKVSVTPYDDNGFGVHALALRSDGSVVGWGDNVYGQLNQFPPNTLSLPRVIESSAGVPFTDVISVAATQKTSAFVKSDGTVWTLGSNSNGQLGIFSPTNYFYTVYPNQVKGPGGVGFLTGIVDVEPLYYGFIALKNDGTVWAWGYNRYGDIGNGNQVQQTAPVQVGGLTNIVSIKGGGQSVAALKSDGTLYVWGDNSGRQAWPSVVNPQTSPVAVTSICQ